MSYGRKLEFNTCFDGMSHALATIVAEDADEALWLEVYVGDQAVHIPLAIVQEALEVAEERMHSEAWYEQQSAYESGDSVAARALSKREPEHGT